MKSALASKSRNSSGTSFFSLAAGTKLNNISLDVPLLDKKNENSIIDSVNRDPGVSVSALSGSSTGNYSTANLNLELVSANVYSWIRDVIDELNKRIDQDITSDVSCRVGLYIFSTIMANKNNMVGHTESLYTRGKDSLYAWIAAMGFDPDNYIALMDHELEENFENRYPVHKTSYTISSDDGGRPSADSDDPSFVQQRASGEDNTPRLSA